jgi:hypothetical protein
MSMISSYTRVPSVKARCSVYAGTFSNVFVRSLPVPVGTNTPHARGQGCCPSAIVTCVNQPRNRSIRSVISRCHRCNRVRPSPAVPRSTIASGMRVPCMASTPVYPTLSAIGILL